jgi:hypothetical protein
MLGIEHPANDPLGESQTAGEIGVAAPLIVRSLRGVILCRVRGGHSSLSLVGHKLTGDLPARRQLPDSPLELRARPTQVLDRSVREPISRAAGDHRDSGSREEIRLGGAGARPWFDVFTATDPLPPPA